MSRFNVTVPLELDYPYTVIEVVIAIAAMLGNLLVIILFCKYKILRTVTNYYVISLAAADFSVGVVGIPSAIATSVGLPKDFQVICNLITTPPECKVVFQISTLIFSPAPLQ